MCFFPFKQKLIAALAPQKRNYKQSKRYERHSTWRVNSERCPKWNAINLRTKEESCRRHFVRSSIIFHSNGRNWCCEILALRLRLSWIIVAVIVSYWKIPFHFSVPMTRRALIVSIGVRRELKLINKIYRWRDSSRVGDNMEIEIFKFIVVDIVQRNEIRVTNITVTCIEATLTS